MYVGLGVTGTAFLLIDGSREASGSSVARGSKERSSAGDSIIRRVGRRRPKVYSICGYVLVFANDLGSSSRLLSTYDEKNGNENEASCENEEDSPGRHIHQHFLVSISYDELSASLRKMCDGGCNHFDDDIL